MTPTGPQDEGPHERVPMGDRIGHCGAPRLEGAGQQRIMRILRWMARSLSVTSLLVVLGWAPANAWAAEILVSAAASLRDAMKKIGRSYQLQSKHMINFNFGPSSGLARQIDEGAPADVFFSANLAQMDRLERNGRLDKGTRKNLLSNQLVMIVPFDSRVTLSSPKDLLKSDVKRIALAEPSSVPAGVYSKKYLVDQALWKKVESKVVPVKDVRATLASVESGNVDAGFVYKTDAAISDRVKFVYEVPLDQGPRITYPVAVVEESAQKDAARDFVRYLESPAATNVFEEYGFIVLD